MQHLAQKIAGERSEHQQIDDTDFDTTLLAHVVRNRLGRRDQAALAQDQVVSIVAAISHHAAVAPARQRMELLERPLRKLLHMIEEVRPLCGDTLHIGVLVLHHAGHDRVVYRPEFRNASALVPVDYFLRRRWRVDLVFGQAQVFCNQFAFRDHQRFDQVGRQETVLADDPGCQRKFGKAVRNDVQIRHVLRVFGKHLEEARVVHAMIIIVPGMHIETRLGHCPATHVQHISQALADGRIQ